MLTDKAVRALLPTDKPQKVYDGRGLHLLVTVAGAKSWRVKYRWLGKEKTLTLGLYPDVSLKQAREGAEDARRALARGIDPGAPPPTMGRTFEQVYCSWFNDRMASRVPHYKGRVENLFQNDILPHIGNLPISGITAPQVLVVVRRIEARVIDRAHRALQFLNQIFNYAIAAGEATANPAAPLRGALKRYEGKHMAAPTEPKDFAAILRRMYGYSGGIKLEVMLKLGPLLFARPGELRKMKWAELDLEAGEWRYTLSKTPRPHIVPLSRQAVALIRTLQPITSGSAYVFPMSKSYLRPMSDAAFNLGLRSCEIDPDELTGHGLRATARTILDEVLEFRPDWIEMQLGHVVKDSNGRAYNRTSFLEGRRKMMQAWSDYIDTLLAG